MQVILKPIGWVLFLAGVALTIVGMLDLSGMVDVSYGFVGLELTRTDDVVTWIIVWLVMSLVGLYLAKPGGKREPSH